MSREFVLRRGDLLAGPGSASLTLPLSIGRGRLDRPGFVLTLGTLATAVLALAGLANVGGMAAGFESIYVLVAAGASALAMAFLARRSGPSLLAYRPLALALALTGAGMLLLDLRPIVRPSSGPVPANLLFAAGGIRAMAVIVPALYRRMDRRTLASTGLDGAIMLFAGITLVVTLWRTSPSGPTGITDLLVPFLAVTLMASAGVAAIAAFSPLCTRPPRCLVRHRGSLDPRSVVDLVAGPFLPRPVTKYARVSTATSTPILPARPWSPEWPISPAMPAAN